MMVFNATFKNISVVYRGGQFYWWRKPENPEKTTDLSQITDKLYHLVLIEIRTHNISGIGSCKSNYHTITTTTAPVRLVYQQLIE